MSLEDFKAEVQNNRPRMALSFLVDVIEDLTQRVEGLESHLRDLKASKEAEVKAEKASAPAKKAPAKKRTAASSK